MKIKGSYLCFALLACACIAVCAYAVADMFADLPSLVFLAFLLAFACIGLWLKDALIGARYLFYCVCVQLLFAAAIFAALKFPAMAQFVRSAEIGTGSTGIPLGASFCSCCRRFSAPCRITTERASKKSRKSSHSAEF